VAPSLTSYSQHLNWLPANRCTHCHNYQTTKYHLEILKRCPLVEDVKVWGYNYKLEKKYPAVLAGLKNLRSLNIIRYCLNDREAGFLMGHGQLLKLVKGWPTIEQIQVPNSYEAHIDHKALGRYCKKRGIKIRVLNSTIPRSFYPPRWIPIELRSADCSVIDRFPAISGRFTDRFVKFD
jgi:hypothetical protein